MDLFEYYQSYSLLICKPCAYAIPPPHLRAHIIANHEQHVRNTTGVTANNRGVRPTGLSRAVTRMVKTIQETYNLVDPRTTKILIPPIDSAPIPGLQLHRGYQCSLCPLIHCSQQSSGDSSLRKHFNSTHRTRSRRAGRPSRIIWSLWEDEEPIFHEVDCQRFFVSGHQSSFFRATAKQARQENLTAIREGDIIRDIINKQLSDNSRELERTSRTFQDRTSKTEVSPWLDVARWAHYCDGLDPTRLVPLANAANPYLERDLLLLSDSLDRLVEQACVSIRNGKVSVFDLATINSFIVGEANKSERPLAVNLQKQTLRTYKLLWKRLLCFTYRASRKNHGLQLRHRLTTAQLNYLDRAMSVARSLSMLLATPTTVSLTAPNTAPGTATNRTQEKTESELDRSCLLLCISLLDHRLRGSHFESVIVGFLAVLSLDEKNGYTFHGPVNYSPYLSRFIKMAQILVIDRAIIAAEEGTVENTSDAISEMHQHFLARGSHTAFDWAYRMRAYAKKEIVSTTYRGFVIWSEDKQAISYKKTTIRLNDFRDFVAVQVRLAQKELRDLLFYKPEEPSPRLHLDYLQDNCSNAQTGWNFLIDPRTVEQLRLAGHNGLLSYILQDRWLMDEFVELGADRQLCWKNAGVKKYLSKVDAFLERLLLLVHLTSGQPARGTELLSLQHCNTAQGYHRSIFLEDGLIGTVTSYHKGYNITGTTKIIHRYLPREVSELLVRYLWLVLPFWQSLEALACHRKDPPSPFLWPKGTGSWNSNRLSRVLSREAAAHMKTSLNVMGYRHIAIAISRMYLRCGGFRDDYGFDQRILDEQATHGSWIAGTIYAREMQEAPGHVEGRRREFRAVGREWHTFLGFDVRFEAGKRRVLEDIDEEYVISKKQCLS